MKFFRNVPEELQGVLKHFLRAVEETLFGPVYRRRAYDVEKAAYMLATFESAQYFQEHMRLAENLHFRGNLLLRALEEAPEEGLDLELGVGDGNSLRFLAEKLEGRTVYGFDSFEGLPEDWTHFQRRGRFGSDGKPPEDLPDNAELVIGPFEETLAHFLAEHPGKVRLLHVDCDLYSSTRTALEALGPRLVPGSILVFDEYFNYPGWRHHEFKAWQEFVAATGLRYEYVAFASSHFSVLIRVVGIGDIESRAESSRQT